MKKVIAFTMVFLLFALGACRQTGPFDGQASLDAAFRANAKNHGIPAQAVLVLHNREVLFREAAGTAAIGGATPVTPKSVFPIFSVSKLFASTLAMQLAEEGKLDLSAPASRYVANLPPSWRDIRVDQFLSHVSGVPEYFESNNLSLPFPASLQAVFTNLADVALISAPSVETRYTQTNYLVIAAILEAVTQTPYRKLVTQRIIEPLGLHDTWLSVSDVPKSRLVESYRAEAGRVVPEPSIAWPDYAIVHQGIYTTIDDIGKFLSAVVQGRLVSKEQLIHHWRPYRSATGDTGIFASGWEYGESGTSRRWREVGHDGGTKVRVRILFGESLDDYYVIAYLTNGSKDGVWSRTLVDSVQQLLLPK
jgi:D-alanyl-D-alanine carboxypeptidase